MPRLWAALLALLLGLHAPAGAAGKRAAYDVSLAEPSSVATATVSGQPIASPKKRRTDADPPEKEALGAAAADVAEFKAEDLGPKFDGSARLRDAVGAVAVAARPAAGPAAPGAPSYDYAGMFDLIRRTTAGPQAARVRTFLRQAFRPELTLNPEEQKRYNLPTKLKDVSGSQFMLLLQNNAHVRPIIETYLAEMNTVKPGTGGEAAARKSWRAAFRGLLNEARLTDEFKRMNEPLEPMTLTLPGNAPGYQGAQVFLDHQGFRDGQWVPPQDLVKVALEFIGGARKSLMLNVFDFDLMEVADALAAKGAEGVAITVGIDKKVIAERPEVQAVFDKLSAAPNVSVVAVDSVGLNHQKMMVRDWQDAKRAKVLFSSGNLTRSCLSPGGDLAGQNVRAPRGSVPNANHMIVLDSFLAAQTVADSLIKTLSPEYRLRGNGYPLGGAFKVSKGDPNDPDMPYMALAFSPRGGLGEVNRDVVRRVILQSRGPIRMLQFAFSSSEVVDALIERARLEVEEGNEFDFKSVGDTPFAMASWSGFLRMSGYELQERPSGKRYLALKSNKLRDILGKERYAKLKTEIRIAPPDYGKHTLKTPQGDVEFDAKIHHKVLISGRVAIAGTSFNFSESAEGNNEQMIVFRDPEIVAAMTAAFEGLYRQSRRSVEEETQRRNARFRRGAPEDPTPTPEDGSR